MRVSCESISSIMATSLVSESPWNVGYFKLLNFSYYCECGVVDLMGLKPDP